VPSSHVSSEQNSPLSQETTITIYSLGDRHIQRNDPVWIADNATVIGSVVLHRHASVFFGAVLRGDNDIIQIGEATNVQDNAVLHTDAGIPLTLGNYVTVGHQAMLHGCEVGDETLIGIGAIILNRAQIGAQCLVGAGTLIPEGKIFPPRSLIVGTPGKVVRELNDEEVARLRTVAEHYVQQWQRYAALLQPA
jgi:carbonic anhydrase/acetyltransferase-like protein (isoleucine patch superfamily)